MSDPRRLFRFAQVEHPWLLGPEPGRYVVRPEGGGDPTHVLVLATLGAPQRRRLAGRKARRVAPEPPPAAVATTRATIIGAEPVASDAEGEAWLAETRDIEVGEARLQAALAVLARAVRAQRAVAADPGVVDPRREQVLVARLGLGWGEQVADGRWEAAVVLPAAAPGPRRGVNALRPQERLAAVLAGREPLLASAELGLRARADLEVGRQREAALGLRVALEAGLLELAGTISAERLDELHSHREAVARAANAALAGELGASEVSGATEALDRLEAALRARVAGLEGGLPPGAARAV